MAVERSGAMERAINASRTSRSVEGAEGASKSAMAEVKS